MAQIHRNLPQAEQTAFDLIVIGGGIHGTMLALESSLQGKKTLLVDKGDFGGATSYNSLRIIHGGFRYLQNLDIHRLRESAHARNWYLENFPFLVKPQKCLFPLYGKGLHRPFFFKIAMQIYDLLTFRRNDGLSAEAFIPRSTLLDSTTTRSICPYLPVKGLKGGAVWYDAFMPDSQRILIGCLRWGAENGLHALNYVRADEIITKNNHVCGLKGIDEITGRSYVFKSRFIANLAGPWCRQIAGKADRDYPVLFRSMLAWNILFDRPSLGNHAIAFSPRSTKSQTYFSVPWKGKMLVGTGQVPWLDQSRDPVPSALQLQSFCDDLNASLPDLNLTLNDILHVYAGLQSATKTGGTKFTKRAIVLDHYKKGGPYGLYSISGIKFTTAFNLAKKALLRIFPNLNKSIDASKNGKPPKDACLPVGVYGFDWMPDMNDASWTNELKRIAEEESIVHLDDLFLRRTSIGDNPERALSLSEPVGRLFNWDFMRILEEKQRLHNHYKYSSIATTSY